MGELKLTDWITIFSVVIIIIGWFVNGYLNRKNEITKERLKYRLPTLKSFLKIWYFVHESNEKGSMDTRRYKELIIEVREDFQLYGEKDEIELFEEFVEYGLGKNLHPEKAKSVLEKLVQLVRKRIRKELNIG